MVFHFEKQQEQSGEQWKREGVFEHLVKMFELFVETYPRLKFEFVLILISRQLSNFLKGVGDNNENVYQFPTVHDQQRTTVSLALANREKKRKP